MSTDQVTIEEPGAVFGPGRVLTVWDAGPEWHLCREVAEDGTLGSARYTRPVADAMLHDLLSWVRLAERTGKRERLGQWLVESDAIVLLDRDGKASIGPDGGWDAYVVAVDREDQAVEDEGGWDADKHLLRVSMHDLGGVVAITSVMRSGPDEGIDHLIAHARHLLIEAQA